VDGQFHHLAQPAQRSRKLKLREAGSRYLFIRFDCKLEKYSSRDDYEKKGG
jgi:hypothetical protein